MILPLEIFIFSQETIEYASLLYLPHAVRIIAYYILGPIALVPIFLSQCFTYLVFNNAELMNTVYLSSVSTLSIFLGFRLYELVRKRNIFNIDKTVDWKKIIIVGFLVSIFNSTLSSIFISLNTSYNYFYESLNFTYLMGDVLGLVFGMFLFIFCLSFYKSWGRDVGS
ncbi:hypothetical protein N9S98_00560 [Alphaproteobacteria bacterium]|nr:hypothetical protein [Alphaproteobacteria bacterium]